MQLADSEPVGFLFRWFGTLHYHLVHFPIALVIMTCVSEVLFVVTGKALFNFASRFMLWAAAISFIPTVIAGYLLSERFVFVGTPLEQTIWWHGFWGILSLILCWFALYLRERDQTIGIYYLVLVILLISICTAGSLGGMMAFS